MAGFKDTDYFKDLIEFVEEIEKTPESKRDSSDENDEEWAGSRDIEQTLEYARYGYEIENIETEMEGLEAHAEARLEPQHDVAGSMVDMGRYMSGEPECMIDFKFTEANNKYIHLMIGTIEAAGLKTKQMHNRAVAIASIVDNLEDNGYRLKLSLVMANTRFTTGRRDGSSQGNFTIVTIKDYDDIVPIANIAGVLHPSFYRRGIFQYWEGLRSWC